MHKRSMKQKWLWSASISLKDRCFLKCWKLLFWGKTTGFHSPTHVFWPICPRYHMWVGVSQAGNMLWCTLDPDWTKTGGTYGEVPALDWTWWKSTNLGFSCCKLWLRSIFQELGYGPCQRPFTWPAFKYSLF